MYTAEHHTPIGYWYDVSGVFRPRIHRYRARVEMISRDMGADIASGGKVEELQLEAVNKQISAVFWN